MNPPPTSQERIWAVISHLSVLAFGMGIALPIIGWSELRHKSKYASFQCLQALGYQSLGYTVWLLSYLLVMILLLVLMVIAMSFAAENSPWAPTVSMLWAGFVVFFALGLFVLYLLFPVIAAVACALGKEYRYPILGNRLANYLGYVEETGLNGQHEERWVASMGHFSVIIVLWGLLAPLTTWIVQGKQSAFLKFQSIQTTIYQAGVNILYLGALSVTWLGTIPLFFVMGPAAGPGQNSSAPILGLVLFFIAMLIGLLILVVLPLFHILGQWAGYRVLKGEEYRYPLLGKLVEQRMKP